MVEVATLVFTQGPVEGIEVLFSFGVENTAIVAFKYAAFAVAVITLAVHGAK